MINKSMKLYFSNNFPYRSYSNKKAMYTVTLGIGGNIGNMKRRFDKLFKRLKDDRRFTIVQTSPLLKNPPFGYLEQDDFLNGIIKLETNLAPKKVLEATQSLELRFGRKRSFQDAPRTLDLDIILMTKNGRPVFVDEEDLKIPHPHYKQRESVTIPLEYIR